MSTSNDRSYEYDDNGQVQLVSLSIWRFTYQPIWTDRDKLQRRKLKRDIESGLVDPNSVNEDGGPLWHFICRRLDDDDVDWATSLFCSEPVQIDARDNFGHTALLLAVYNDLEKITELLLSEGANPNLANDGGETPLHDLCRKSSDHVVPGWAQTFFKICDERQLQVRVDAKDRLGRTPLQWAVANFKLDLIDVLLARGADLSSFVFPVKRHFYERFRTYDRARFRIKAKLASGIMMAVEHLERKGCELELSDALTIMNFFANHGLFEESPAIEKCLNNEDFVCRVKGKMIKPNLSYYDLIQLRPEEAAKQLKYMNYFKFVSSTDLDWLPNSCGYREAWVAHLCEKLSNNVFRSWALEPFWKLIHYRLPILCCEMIIENLTNKDLYHICLVAQGQTIRNGKICVIKRNNERPVRARKAPKRLKIEW
ncbi:hypothetical protein TKK_0003112 [Trichogramma kaykai]